jgi:DNA-binding SARP family transcriptional activator
MNTPDTMLEIRTLGCFSITINGKRVAITWPDETVKILFCSLLSPLDLYFTWDRICRSLWNIPETRSSRHRLEEIIINPLTIFLIKELGYNPLILEKEGIRIDLHSVHIDAHEFHSSVVEGLSLSAIGNHAAAFEKLMRADTLYLGSYLPGMPGNIIEHTRNDLESLYKNAVVAGTRQTA